MANPHCFYFRPSTNGANSDTFGASSTTHPTQLPPDYIHRLHQQAENLERERQRFYALCVQLEQEKRTILAWNLQLSEENAALKDEVTQLKQQQKWENGKRGDQNWRETNAKRTREMNSLEMIEALIGKVQHERPLITTDGNVTAKDGRVPIGISDRMRQTLEANPAKEGKICAGEKREFGQMHKIEQIISSILDNHSSALKKRRQLNDGAEQQQHIGGDDCGGNGPADGDIEYIGIGPLCPSMADDAENEFTPPPKTPPPPLTPPLPPQNFSTVSAETFEAERQTTSSATTDEQIIFADTQPSLTDADLNNGTIDGQKDAAADGGPDGGGENGEEEVIFVDDVCLHKWMPSMAKREPTTDWTEIVLEDEEQREEGIDEDAHFTEYD